MTATFESTMREDLDRLAGNARRPLSRRQRLRASDRAAAVALRVLPGVGACVLLIRLIAGGSMALMTAIALSVTLAIGGVVFLRQVARIHVGRVEALALADRRLALGDRAVIAAQFVDERARDGFREAALVEAKPWVERALDRTVSADDDPVHDWRRSLPHALAGLAMLVVATVAVRTPERGAQAPRASATTPGRSIDTAATGSLDAAGLHRFDPANAVRRIAAAVGLGGADPATSGAAGRGDGASAPGSGGANGGRAGSAEAAGTGGRGGGDGGGSGETGNGGMTGTEGASGSDDAGSADGAAGAPDTPTDRGDPAAREGQAPSAVAAAAPAAAGWPAGGSPPAADGGNGTPRQGGGLPNSGKSSSQRGESGSSGAPSGQTQGQGNGTGTDAVKRSRGLAALMLALPMEDKLAGTPNRGPARSSLRRTSPTPGATAPAAAGSRGTQNGAIGLASHRPLVVQDEALVARYFDRNAGTPGRRR